jgi:hypothetical protein
MWRDRGGVGRKMKLNYFSGREKGLRGKEPGIFLDFTGWIQYRG